MGARARWVAFFGDTIWKKGEPCPGCEHKPEVHSKTSRIVGCQAHGDSDPDFPGMPWICGCRRLRYENPPEEGAS